LWVYVLINITAFYTVHVFTFTHDTRAGNATFDGLSAMRARVGMCARGVCVCVCACVRARYQVNS